jgi:hypothetical protein
MTLTAVSTPPPETATAPVPEAPPKRRPKLSPELRKLEEQLRADAPDEALRFGTCVGTEQQPHVQELWLTYLQPASCPTCARPVQSYVLEPDGGNGGK